MLLYERQYCNLLSPILTKNKFPTNKVDRTAYTLMTYGDGTMTSGKWYLLILKGRNLRYSEILIWKFYKNT